MILNAPKSKRTKVMEDGTIVELVPPEGGWGYMICVSFVILFVTGMGPQTCFGLIYNDFLQNINQGTSVVTAVQCVSTVTVSISAVATAVALKRISIRKVCLVGVFVGTLAAGLSIFVSSAYEMIVYAIIQSAGLGVVATISYTSFNSYFIEKRVYVLSICKSVGAGILMVYPLMIEYFMNKFGFRGTLAMLCGISANNFIGALLLQSVEKHLVVKKTTATSYEDDSKSKANSIKDTKCDPVLEKLLLPMSERKKSISQTIIIVKEDRTQSIDGQQDENKNMKIISAKTGLENNFKALSQATIVSHESAFVAMNVEKGSKLRIIAKLFDLDLLKDWVFVNINVGLSFCFFSDATFSMLLPLMLFNNNFNKEEVAICLSSLAAGDFASRLIIVFISRWIKLKPRNVVYFGAIASFVLRFAFNFVTGFYLAVSVVFLLGMSKCLLHLMPALALADHVRMDQFPSAFALFTVSNGLISTALAPIVGFVRDITGSYNKAFGLLTSAFLVCIIPWTIEFVIVKKHQNKS